MSRPQRKIIKYWLVKVNQHGIVVEWMIGPRDDAATLEQTIALSSFDTTVYRVATVEYKMSDYKISPRVTPNQTPE